MANVAGGIERKLLSRLAQKYPKPLHQMLYNPLHYPTEYMEHREKTERRLIQVLAQVPHWGIGRLVTSVEWTDRLPTYWRITRVHVDHLTPNFEYGIAWGVYTDKGRSRGYEEEIQDTNEFLWRLIPKYEEQKYSSFKPQSKDIKEVPLYNAVPPLLSQMIKSQRAKEGRSDCNKEPLVRMLIRRGPIHVERQKLEDGTLV